MLTGRAARTTTWRVLDEWISENSSDAETGGSTPGRSRTARTPAGGRKPAAKPAARKAASPSSNGARAKSATKAPTKAAPRKDAIGANPDRRYGSGSSRSLAPKK
jgi:polyhydroxyalkanoate synthase